MASSVSAWHTHWPAAKRLLAVYESRYIQSPIWRTANVASWAIVLVCAVRAVSDSSEGLWPSAVTWLAAVTALAALTPVSLAGPAHLATVECAQLRGVSASSAHLSAWSALYLMLLRLFLTRGVLIALLASGRRANSWLVSLPLSVVLSIGIGCLLCTVLVGLRAMSHTLSPAHPRRLFLLMLLAPPLLSEFVGEIPSITSWYGSLVSKCARLLDV